MTILKVTAITALLYIDLLATTVFTVVAQVAPSSAKSSGEHVKGYDDWHFAVNLSGWLSSFQGDVGALGDTSHIDVALDDVLELLFHGKIDFTIDGRFEVRKGPWGFYTDLEYVRLSDSGTGQKSIDIPIFRPPGFAIQGNAKVVGEYSLGEAALSYDVYASPCLVANMPELIVEVLGGPRYQYLRTKVNLELAGPLRDRNFEADESKSWVDPFVRGHILWRPGVNWLTSLEGDFRASPSVRTFERSTEGSKPYWAPRIEPGKGAPNVLLIMTDDSGYGVPSTFGGVIPTPGLDRIANNRLRYTQFHSTALCSPTRAALITGRNHHSVGFGVIAEQATGYPGYDSIIAKDKATIGRILKDNGYHTSWFGKNHNTPAFQASEAGPFDQWPIGMGFNYFYGFMGGDTNQRQPANLARNTTYIYPFLDNQR